MTYTSAIRVGVSSLPSSTSPAFQTIVDTLDREGEATVATLAGKTGLAPERSKQTPRRVDHLQWSHVILARSPRKRASLDVGVINPQVNAKESNSLTNTKHVMVWGFASKEIEDARDRVNSGSYSAAATFVSNAKADIEDAPVDFGIWKDELDNYHDEFQKEVDKLNPNENHLNYVLDELERILGEMREIRAEEEDGYNPD